MLCYVVSQEKLLLSFRGSTASIATDCSVVYLVDRDPDRVVHQFASPRPLNLPNRTPPLKNLSSVQYILAFRWKSRGKFMPRQANDKRRHGLAT
jgi:hypothetical protein